GALERWDDAIADTRRVHEIAVRKQGEGSFFAIVSLTDGASAQCRAGPRAEAHLAFPGAALQDGVDYAWGACLLADGQVDAAARRLAGIHRAAVAQLTGDPDWG